MLLGDVIAHPHPSYPPVPLPSGARCRQDIFSWRQQCEDEPKQERLRGGEEGVQGGRWDGDGGGVREASLGRVAQACCRDMQRKIEKINLIYRHC